LSMILYADDIPALSHQGFESLDSGCEVSWLVSQLSKLTDAFEEFIGRARKLRLEERKPKDLSVDTPFQVFTDGFFQVVVNDVLHVNGIQVIGPWVENLEALVLDALLSISFYIVLQELEAGLVGLDWVAKVILVHRLLMVSQEATNSFDAGG
jgi:hypothetical protein